MTAMNLITKVIPRIPCWLTLFMAAVFRVTKSSRTKLTFPQRIMMEVMFSIIIWSLLYPYPNTIQRYSIIPWWSLVCTILCQWPYVFSTATSATESWSRRIVTMLHHGGPLGPGCSKLVETLTGIILYAALHEGTMPPIVIFGPDFVSNVLFNKVVWIVLVIICVGVNVVMNLWSKLLQTRGNHNGVNDMVESTQNRDLSLKEKTCIFALALINATVEEITSRYFYMREFRNCFKIEFEQEFSSRDAQFYGNLMQALVFGIWHYNGIPSGMTGVILTFVYGIIMGYLYLYNGSSGSSSDDNNDDNNIDVPGALFLPIVAHTIADYYIFAIIARRKQQNQHDKQG